VAAFSSRPVRGGRPVPRQRRDRGNQSSRRTSTKTTSPLFAFLPLSVPRAVVPRFRPLSFRPPPKIKRHSRKLVRAASCLSVRAVTLSRFTHTPGAFSSNSIRHIPPKKKQKKKKKPKNRACHVTLHIPRPATAINPQFPIPNHRPTPNTLSIPPSHIPTPHSGYLQLFYAISAKLGRNGRISGSRDSADPSALNAFHSPQNPSPHPRTCRTCEPPDRCFIHIHANHSLMNTYNPPIAHKSRRHPSGRLRPYQQFSSQST